MEWVNGDEPRYRAGQQVWGAWFFTTDGPKAAPVVIRSPIVHYLPSDAGVRCAFTGLYATDRYWGYFDRPADYLPKWVSRDFLFDTQEDAERAAKWWPCDLTEEEWKAAQQATLGYRSGDGGEVWEMRTSLSTLIRWCSYQKGFMEVNRLMLADIIKDHPPVGFTSETAAAIAKILKALDMQWPTKEVH